MSTTILKTSQPETLSQAIRQVQAGKVIVIPTDTVYGLGCSLFNPDGISRMYSMKGRDSAKAIAVLLADPDQIDQVTLNLDERAKRLAEVFWPGALTLVVNKNPAIPEILSSLPTVGIRIPDDNFTRALIRAVGPMAVTSANLAGQASSTTVQEALDQLGEQVEVYVDGGKTPGGMSSTVVDCTGAEPVVLREGPVSVSGILQIWNSTG
jgi:L-threonylcarbamoyladenylate synthase